MLQLTTIIFLISFFVLALTHIVAIKLFLYWHFLWLDMPMHCLGGIVVALGFFTLRDLGVFPNKFLKLVPVVLLVLGVALIWETFEFFIGVPIVGNYLSDTSSDICMGILGGVLGFYIGNSLRNLH